MCGVLGVVANNPVGQVLYDGLQMLQHRGQNAAGIATIKGDVVHLHKGDGLTSDVFRMRDMLALEGNMGIGHVRYPTTGSFDSPAEAQPFYVNSPYGLVLCHNGNLTNTQFLRNELVRQDHRHVNTRSDSEVLLNVLAHELQEVATGHELDPEMIFAAVSGVHRRCQGAYAVVVLIAGYGLLAFRDPYGIRPLVFGKRETHKSPEYMVASESVAFDLLGFTLERDVAPGEAIFISMEGTFYNKLVEFECSHYPCIFEYVYLARPDSIIDGVSVYESRRRMGEYLAAQINKEMRQCDIDVVIPIPDSSRPCALEVAHRIGVKFREGLVKNSYVGRTFMMPRQTTRKKSVRQKLNPIGAEFKGKSVLLVDDSIVRGTTSREIVQMARDAGAVKVYLASAAPPICFQNVYGIDMPTRRELIAFNRSTDEIAFELGVDSLIYQEIDALTTSVRKCNSMLYNFECSCFNGVYITGDISDSYLSEKEITVNNNLSRM